MLELTPSLFSHWAYWSAIFSPPWWTLTYPFFYSWILSFVSPPSQTWSSGPTKVHTFQRKWRRGPSIETSNCLYCTIVQFSVYMSFFPTRWHIICFKQLLYIEENHKISKAYDNNHVSLSFVGQLVTSWWKLALLADQFCLKPWIA